MRVLLIEDDSATAQGIELMLKSEGFNVYTTDLGEEGVDLGEDALDELVSEPALESFAVRARSLRLGPHQSLNPERLRGY